MTSCVRVSRLGARYRLSQLRSLARRAPLHPASCHLYRLSVDFIVVRKCHETLYRRHVPQVFHVELTPANLRLQFMYCAYVSLINLYSGTHNCILVKVGPWKTLILFRLIIYYLYVTKIFSISCQCVDGTPTVRPIRGHTRLLVNNSCVFIV